MNLYSDDEYALGASVATMASLRLMDVAAPDQIVWRDAAVFYPRSDMSRVGDGLPSFDWIWDVISISRLAAITSLISGAESGHIYVHTNRRIGTAPNLAAEFGVYYAMMYKPVLSGQEGVSVARATISLQTVKLTFVNAVAV